MNPSELIAPATGTSLPRPRAFAWSTWVRYIMSERYWAGAPSNAGPGAVYIVHPSAHCWPVASGPLVTRHLRRSNLAIWDRPPQICQTTAWLLTVMPPSPGHTIYFAAGSEHSTLQVCVSLLAPPDAI